MPRRLLCVVVASAVAGVACRGRSAPTTIRIAHESDVISLDPAAQQETATHSILSNFYEGLVAFDKDMTLAPALALSWNTPDETTWVIQLRKGVRFHDGRPLTASDVKYTLDRARSDPSSAIQGLLASLESVVVVDEGTVKLKTRSVEPLLMNRLSYVLIVPARRANEDPSRPVGTGPYRVVGWRKGVALAAEAFEGYWNGRPSVDRVEFVPVEEGEASVTALKAGRVDVLRWLPGNMVEAFRSIPGMRIQTRAGLATYYLWMNSLDVRGRRNPFADRRVRQAISVAVDRRRIVRELQGYGIPALQLVPPGVFGYIAGLPEPAFDPEAARRLLREAGYAGGFETTLVHRPQASVVAVAELIRAMLRPVGIRVTLDAPPWPRVLEGWDATRLPFFLAGWRFEDGDATGFLRECVLTKEPARHRGMNNAGFSNPELDRLIEENGRILGEKRRLAQYDTLMRLAMEEVPVVPLYHRQNLYGVSTRVRWQPRLDGKLLAAEMSFEGTR